MGQTRQKSGRAILGSVLRGRVSQKMSSPVLGGQGLEAGHCAKQLLPASRNQSRPAAHCRCWFESSTLSNLSFAPRHALSDFLRLLCCCCLLEVDLRDCLPILISQPCNDRSRACTEDIPRDPTLNNCYNYCPHSCVFFGAFMSLTFKIA